jgi:hypothetical protein
MRVYAMKKSFLPLADLIVSTALSCKKARHSYFLFLSASPQDVSLPRAVEF